MVLVIAVLVYRDTLFVLVPSFETWRQAGTDLADAWDAFGVVKAPTPAIDGFLVAGGVMPGGDPLSWSIMGVTFEIEGFTMTRHLASTTRDNGGAYRRSKIE